MSKRRRKAKTKSAGDRAAHPRRNAAWDARLRHVGDANCVTVAWSTRDAPSWPLPRE